MTKRIIIFGIVLFFVLAAGGIGGYFFFSWKNKSTTGSLTSIIPQTESKEEVTADKTYTDESGFSFGYPKDIRVSDVTPDEDVYYSMLTLSKGGSQITLSVKDTTIKTIDDWVKTELSGASLFGAVNLGGVSAKQYTSGKKLYTVAIDQGVLYLIEGPKDDGYWEGTQNLAVSTFKIGNTTSSSFGSENAIYEEEEIVE